MAFVYYAGHGVQLNNQNYLLPTKEKFTSENMGDFYKLKIGPIENEVANKLVSTFILKGYKENEIILE